MDLLPVRIVGQTLVHRVPRDQLQPDAAFDPSGYFLRQCYAATDSDEKYLAAVIGAIGDANVVVATDYPHRDCLFPEAIDKLVERDDVSLASKERILWHNVARLYPRAVP